MNITDEVARMREAKKRRKEKKKEGVVTTITKEINMKTKTNLLLSAALAGAAINTTIAGPTDLDLASNLPNLLARAGVYPRLAISLNRETQFLLPMRPGLNLRHLRQLIPFQQVVNLIRVGTLLKSL